jgi:3-oxoacyl-ACP reductase-like protein
MGLLSNLISKIFSHAPAVAPIATGASAPPTPASTSVPPPTTPAAASSSPPPAPAPAAPPPATPPKPVDVTAILDGLAAKNPEKLDWKKSIVDLMKLVGMDSSFAARKELAKELHYTGDPNDSAAMNIWLHKQVLTKIAENGGKVPAGLLD